MSALRRPLAVVLLIGGLQASAAAGDLALIVHPENPETGLSSAEVTAVFRQVRQHWKSGGRIYLILQQAGTPEKDLVLRRIYGMTDAELKQFWLGKLFRGEIATFPHVASSNRSAKRLVAHARQALSFVDVATVDVTVKVLRIDGRLPGEPGYFLSATAR